MRRISILLFTLLTFLVSAAWPQSDAPKKGPSRPGGFHPESLTEPYVTVSSHTARAPLRNLPASHDSHGSSQFPGWPWSSLMVPHPFAPCPLQALHRSYEWVRPFPAHRYFRSRLVGLVPFRLSSLARLACSITEPELDSRRLYAEALHSQ